MHAVVCASCIRFSDTFVGPTNIAPLDGLDRSFLQEAKRNSLGIEIFLSLADKNVV